MLIVIKVIIMTVGAFVYDGHEKREESYDLMLSEDFNKCPMLVHVSDLRIV